MNGAKITAGIISLLILAYWVLIYPWGFGDGTRWYLIGGSLLWLMALFIAAKPKDDGTGQGIGVAYIVLLGLIVWAIISLRSCVAA